MNQEPRHRSDYGEREREAARRVLIDIHQVLGGYKETIVLVGGWVPDLLFDSAEERHIGSIDVDLALDAKKLREGKYAKLLKLLLHTGRYFQADDAFRFFTTVDLNDGKKAIRVEVDFLASKKIKLKRSKIAELDGFRILQADACENAFRAPEQILVAGPMINGIQNKVEVQVAALPDFLLMKAFALGQRDKPKDAYDICYCLGQAASLAEVANEWRDRRNEPDVVKAIAYLKQKFNTIDSFGPQQVVLFQDTSNPEEGPMVARRAFELVRAFLELVEAPAV